MEAVSERRFGVEIEFGITPRDGGYSRSYYGEEEVIRILRDNDYPVNYDEDENYCERECCLVDQNKVWSVGSDGTEVELRTPVLQGVEGYKTLDSVMRLLNNHGGYVTRSDGMHVHHEALDFIGVARWGRVARLAKSWVDNEKLIDKFVHPYRRHGNGSAPKNITDGTVLQLKQGRVTSSYSRGALNLNNIIHANRRPNIPPSQPTIEIRLHEGTLDPTEAIAWVQFGQGFLDSAVRSTRPIRACKDELDLLKRVGMEKDKESMQRLLTKAATLGIGSAEAPQHYDCYDCHDEGCGNCDW